MDKAWILVVVPVVALLSGARVPESADEIAIEQTVLWQSPPPGSAP